MITFSLLAVGLLLSRYLAKPQAVPRRRKVLFLFEILAWGGVLLLDINLSDFNLLTAGERFGTTCTLALAGALLAFPVTLLRRTDLRRRIASLPEPAIAITAFLYLAIAGFFAVRSFIVPQSFI